MMLLFWLPWLTRAYGSCCLFVYENAPASVAAR